MQTDVIEKQQTDTELLFQWQLLEEERLEARLQKEFKDAKSNTLKLFNEEFVPLYELSNKFLSSSQELTRIDFAPKFKYKQVGDYRFKVHTFPVKIKEWFEKSPGDIPQSLINVIAEVNPDPFGTALTDSVFRGVDAGGQSVFKTFDIGIDFALLDPNVENYLRNYQIQLASAVTTEISNKIKFEILDGIRNFESIPEIRGRILEVWNKPIEVNVSTKIDTQGNVLRQGYRYNISPDKWATTVARTEVSRAFASGRLESYKQIGVVEKVQFMVTPDERLCPNCNLMDGQIFTIPNAAGLIPLHAMCRCTWIPVLKGDVNAAKTQAAQNVEKLYKNVKKADPFQKAVDARWATFKDKHAGELKKIKEFNKNFKKPLISKGELGDLYIRMNLSAAFQNDMIAMYHQTMGAVLHSQFRVTMLNWYGSANSGGAGLLKNAASVHKKSSVLYHDYEFIDHDKSLIKWFKDNVERSFKGMRMDPNHFQDAFKITQMFSEKFLTEVYGKTIKLYRGVKADYFEKLGIKKGSLSTHDTLNVGQNSLTSWTVSKDVAREFSRGEGSAVLEIEVNVSDILNHFISPFVPGIEFVTEFEMMYMSKGIDTARIAIIME